MRIVDRRVSRGQLMRSAAAAGGIAAGALSPFGSYARSASSQTKAVPLTVLEHQPLRLRLLAAEIPRFEQLMAARGTPIQVQLQAGPTSDNEFQTMLTVGYVSGNGPDVTSFPSSWTPDLMLANALKDLSPYVTAWPDWQRDWYPTMRDAATWNGHIYFLPREAAVYSLYYRHDLLRAHGISIEQPRTWDELLSRGREIKRKTGKFALNFPAGRQWGAGTFDEGFIHLMLGSGSPIFNDATRRWVVKSPGLLRVFEFYYTAATEDLLPVHWLNMPNPWVPIKYGAFPRGDLLVTTSGSWSWEFDWGRNGAAPIADLFAKVATWQFPSVDGRPFTTAGMGWTWAVADRSAQADAAWEFVKYMTGGRPLADNLVAIGAVSPRDDVAARQPEYGRLPFLVAAEHSLRDSRPLRPRPGEGKVQFLIEQATQRLIDGTSTPDKVMAAFATAVQDALGATWVEQH